MQKIFYFISFTMVVYLLLSCGEDGSSNDNPFITQDQATFEEQLSSGSLVENTSGSKQDISSSEIYLERSSSSEEQLSSGSLVENTSDSKQDISSSEIYLERSCSSEEQFSSSSSEERSSSSSEYISSSSSLVLGRCKTSTEDICIYGELRDERDGKTYKTVVIGTQEWMAENLNYSDSSQTPNLQGGSWCYNNDTLNCAKYGRLYRWTAAIDTLESDCGAKCTDLKTLNHQGICPQGWHLPDTSEFMKLFDFIKKYSPNNYYYDLLAISETNGTDAFGFSLLYAGEVGNFSQSNPLHFFALGTIAYLWTSVATDSNSSGAAYFKKKEVYISKMEYRSSGFSVRCVKDSVGLQ